MHLSVLLLLPILLSESLRAPDKMFNDPDLWWHLCNAKILVTQHHFIWSEPYAFTVLNHPWYNPEWLAELPFWFGYSLLGAFGIYLVTWALLYANVALIYIRAKRRANPEPAFWASLGALLLFTSNAGPRTILCGYVLMSLQFFVIDLYEEGRKNIIWLLPAIFAVWVNTHGSWLLGIIIFVLYLIPGWFNFHVGTFDNDKRSWKDQRNLLLVLLSSIIAVFANPYGWHLAWNPFDMILKQKLNIASIQEWQPLNLEWFIGKDAVLIIGIMIVAAMLKSRKWKIYELLWVLFAWYAAFDHIRFTFLAGVIITPFLAMDFSRLIWKERVVKELYALNIIFAIASLCLVIYIIPKAKNDVNSMNSVWPDSLINIVQPSWRTFNQYEMGGRFAFDGKPDFVDSRVDTFEHAGVYGDYIKAINIDSPFEILDKYKIDHILFTEKKPFTYVVEHSPQWSVLKRDHEWVLLERKTQKK